MSDNQKPIEQPTEEASAGALQRRVRHPVVDEIRRTLENNPKACWKTKRLLALAAEAQVTGKMPDMRELCGACDWWDFKGTQLDGSQHGYCNMFHKDTGAEHGNRCTGFVRDRFLLPPNDPKLRHSPDKT